jgi:hypothetical protein
MGIRDELERLARALAKEIRAYSGGRLASAEDAFRQTAAPAATAVAGEWLDGVLLHKVWESVRKDTPGALVTVAEIAEVLSRLGDGVGRTLAVEWVADVLKQERLAPGGS